MRDMFIQRHTVESVIRAINNALTEEGKSKVTELSPTQQDKLVAKVREILKDRG